MLHDGLTCDLRCANASCSQGQHEQHDAEHHRGRRGEAEILDLVRERRLVDVLHDQQGAVPGPPPVSTKTSSKVCTARISASTITTIRLGHSSGSVMRQKTRQRGCASISAAS